MAKQIRLPFSNSVSQSTVNFDLIRDDIWGPYSIPTFSGEKYFLTIIDN